MAGRVTAAIVMQKGVFEEAEALARQLNVPRRRILGAAVEHFFKAYEGQARADEMARVLEADQPSQAAPTRTKTSEVLETSEVWTAGEEDESGPAGERAAVRQGDVYWTPLDEPEGVEPGYCHPGVVIQDDALNRSRLQTVVVCALTSNLKRANLPGNVRLEAGEANLPRPSVVVVSQVSAVDKAQLGEYIGTLRPERVEEVLRGMRFLWRMQNDE